MTVWVIEHREVPGRPHVGTRGELAYFSRRTAEDAIVHEYGSYGPAALVAVKRTMAPSPGAPTEKEE